MAACALLSSRFLPASQQEERVGREQRRRTDEVLREADALRDEVKRLKRDARMVRLLVQSISQLDIDHLSASVAPAVEATRSLCRT